jgi:hypothetical protein
VQKLEKNISAKYSQIGKMDESNQQPQRTAGIKRKNVPQNFGKQSKKLLIFCRAFSTRKIKC